MADSVEHTVLNDYREIECPRCGQLFEEPRSFLNEYWTSSETVYFCWCSNCLWRGEITRSGEVTEVERVTATEPEED